MDRLPEGPVDAARLLLEKRRGGRSGAEERRTPLYFACQNGRVDVARLLLDKG